MKYIMIGCVIMFVFILIKWIWEEVRHDNINDIYWAKGKRG